MELQRNVAFLKKQLWVLILILNAMGLATIVGRTGEHKKGKLVVVRSLPHRNADPASTKEILIEFGAALDPKSVTEESLQLIPATRGTVTLYDRRFLRMQLAEPLRSATRYRIRLAKSLKGMHGETPPEVPMVFCTTPLTVTGIHAHSKQLSPVVEINFNLPVDPQDLEQHLQLDNGKGEAVTFSIVGAVPSKQLVIRIAAHETVKLRISTELSSTVGPLGLRDPYETSFYFTPRPETGSAQRMELHSITGHASLENPYINIRLNTRIDPIAVRPFISVTPALTFNIEERNDGFRLTGRFVSGKRYTITLAEGMHGKTTSPLKHKITRTVWFGDLPKRVWFNNGGGILSPHGLLKVPLNSVNLRSVRLVSRRLYAANLVEFVLTGERHLARYRGTTDHEHHIKISLKPNQHVQTLLNLREIIGKSPGGIHLLRAEQEDKRWYSHQVIVAVTDLGLSVRLGKSSVLCWVNSISKALPVANAKLTIYSNKRRPIGSGDSGEDGVAYISLTGCDPGEHPAMAVVAHKSDLSYTRFSNSFVPRPGSRHFARKSPDRNYEAFCVSERGVYRPGDKVQFSSLIRAGDCTVVPAMPLDVVVIRPGGKVFHRQRVKSDRQGRVTHSFTIPAALPCGNYQARLCLPGSTKPVGKTSFRIADYIPHTLRVSVAVPERRFPTGSAIPVSAKAEHLFGDPASGLTTKCRVRFTPCSFRHAKWPGYSFTSDNNDQRVRKIESRKQKLKSDGTFCFSITPPTAKTPLQAVFEIEVQETGGRAVTATTTRYIDSDDFYIGIRPLQDEISVEKPARFHIAAVKPGGEKATAAREWTATLAHVVRTSVLRRSSDGRLHYEWVTRENPAGKYSGIFNEGETELTLTPQWSGSYLLRINGVTRYRFYATGPGTQWSSNSPEELVVKLDRKRYCPGDEVTARLIAPFSGTALVCVETDRILSHRIVRISEREATVAIPVTDEWRQGAYITATLIRAVTPEKKWQPHRASGLALVPVDSRDRRLSIELQGDGEVAPSSTHHLRVQVKSGDKPVDGAAVIVAAVDEGVLSLSAYSPPSPWTFFYSARQLGVTEHDLYSRLAPEHPGWGKLPTPGGGGGLSLSGKLSPIRAKRVKTVVLYAGSLTTDAEGIASADFIIPQYLGNLKVMAFAADGTRMGSMTRDLTVRSEVMFRASWPRFAAVSDRFEVPITLFNQSAREGVISVELEAEECIDKDTSFPLGATVPAGGSRTLRFSCTAHTCGVARIRLTARLGEASYHETLELPVRPAMPKIQRTGRLTLKPGSAEQLILPNGFLKGTGKAMLTVSGTPRAELSGALRYLLKYPYGCVEQTTSRMIPLVYLPDLAKDSVNREETGNMLRQGFYRLLSMQTRSGGLAMWPGGGEPYDWGTLYAGHCLLEAKKAGYKVPEQLLNPLLRYAERQLRSWNKHDKLLTASYSCDLLARAGRPPHQWISRLEERVKSGSSRIYLASAILAAGEAEAAEKLLSNIIPRRTRERGGSLRSPVRQSASLLLALLDVNPESGQIPALAERLRKSLKTGRWGTTQENAFAIMAMGKLARVAPFTEGKISVTLPDGSTKSCSNRLGMAIREVKPGDELTIYSGGSSHIFWQTEGVPTDGEVEELDKVIAVRRNIYNRAGAPLTNENLLVQGELYQIVLRISTSTRIDNIVVTDLLPAGLEIENIQLKGSSGINAAPPVKGCNLRHTERRDDRILFFVDDLNDKAELHYTVRAVTAGNFILPPVEANCMYDPEVRSIHGGGMIEVIGRK